jgi:hypothetical protein
MPTHLNAARARATAFASYARAMPATARAALPAPPATRPALPVPVVPFAVAMRAPLRPDLVPLDRPLPDRVEDPGPPTLLRLDAGTAGLVSMKRRRVAADPTPWTASADLPDARARTAGRELAAVVARTQPRLLHLEDGRLVIPDTGVTVDDADRVATPHRATSAPADMTAARVRERLERVAPSHRWLEAVALAVAEDLVLVDRGAHAVWLHVCAPSGWDPGNAGGAPLAALHGPIPDADRLRAASAALGRALVEGGPYVRWTWGLTPDPSLAHHVRRRPSPPERPPAPGALTFRAERQTTTPLPDAGLGLFAIRVHRAPLARIVTSPGRADALAATVRALPEELADYKGVADRRDELLAWLEQTAPVASGR